MSTEKQIKARQQQKTDTTENWEIAGQKGFIPKKGEYIVYQDEGKETKFKIGDGATNINDLDFFTNGGGVGKATQEGGEIFNDYTNNQAGILGYSIGHIKVENDVSYIHTVDSNGFVKADFTEGVTISIICDDAKYPNCGKVSGYEENVLKIDTQPISEFDVNKNYYIYSLEEPQKGELLIGSFSHAEGWQTKAIDLASHAEGLKTLAQGQYSHAEGDSTQAIGHNTHAEGYNNKAIANYSHAEGMSNQVEGHSAHAEGRNTRAKGPYSHTEGYGTIAAGDKQHAQGIYNIEDTENKYAHIVGNGTSTNKRSNAHTLDWLGNAWFAGKVQDKDGILANQLELEKVNKKFEDYATTVYVDSKYYRVGHKAEVTPGPRTTAEGTLTEATADCAHAEGYNTKAYGESSHVEGRGSEAHGIGSHAENTSKAYGDYSHAEGKSTQAHGNNSHTEGGFTQTHAEYTHAEGYYTRAERKYQHVQGLYNIVDKTGDANSKGKYAHIVGNGTATTKRSNAHTLDWEGNAWFAGDVKIGGTGQDDANAKTLATQEYVNSKVVSSGSGVYVGSGDMPEDCNVQIDPNGEAFTVDSLTKMVATEIGIVNEASGSVITLNDSSNRELQGLTLKGKNLLDLSLIIGKSVSQNGGTLVCGKDSGITGSGTPTGGCSFYDFQPLYLPNGIYTLSRSGTFTNMSCAIYIRDADGNSLSSLSVNDNSNAAKKTFNTNDFPTYSYVTFEIKRSNNGVEMSGTAYFQLEVGSTATPYVPYFSGGDVTVKVMGKNIADIYAFSACGLNTPESTRSLTNNYGTTISTTEPGNTLTITQTQCPKPNNVSYENGYFIIGFYHKIKDGETITVSFDAEITNDLSGNDIFGFMVSGVQYQSAPIINGKVKATFQWKNYGDRQYLEVENHGKSMVISNIQIEYGNTATDYKSFKSQTLTVSVPDDLAAGEQFEVENFAQLHTYKPNTTITNDVGAIMEVEYVADTKAYIDNKFTELQNAILASGANV